MAKENLKENSKEGIASAAPRNDGERAANDEKKYPQILITFGPDGVETEIFKREEINGRMIQQAVTEIVRKYESTR